MESVLIQLGLSQKEAKFYLLLLGEGLLTASEIAKRTTESRTNTYMLLEKLASEGLILPDSNSTVKRFRAADPSILSRKLNEQEKALADSRKALDLALPLLEGKYKAGEAKRKASLPESLKRYQALIAEAVSASGTLAVIAGAGMPANREAWALVEAVISGRQSRGLNTQLVHYVTDAAPRQLAGKGLTVKSVSEKPQTGGAIIFGRKVILIAHTPRLGVNEMNNEALSSTFKAVFAQLWQSGKGGKA